MRVRSFLIGLMAFLLPVVAFAADAVQFAETPQLQKCLKRADDLPDIAALEAAVWIKKGGGNDAHLCRAFAQANRGMYADSAREFWFLASFFDKINPARAILMHNLSGQQFLRDKDVKNAEGQYAATLKTAPDNVEGLIGRAQTRMAHEKYWDALDDLNHALKMNADSVDALRQRGSVWMHLGNDKNAQEDFEHAGGLAGEK